MPDGCLFFLKRLIQGPQETNEAEEAQPNHKRRRFYKRKWFFDSQAEKHFYNFLAPRLKDKFVLFCHVRLIDLVDCKGGQGVRNTIDRLHVDFVLCRGKAHDYQPVLVIELDGPSHQTPKQQERDEKKDNALQEAELPILRFPVANYENPTDELKTQTLDAIRQHLD